MPQKFNMRLSVLEIAEITGGELKGADQTVAGVVVDSRKIVGGELFIPLRDRRDGHDWIPSALEAGAVAYLTEQEPLQDTTSIRVGDTRRALQSLAEHALARMDARVIGITGSVGKTTTKDLVNHVLGRTFRTHASAKSYNNDIGIPLTLLAAPLDTEMLVLEMGANAGRELAGLAKIYKPSIGVVTRVALAHTEGFGDIDGVFRAKRELVEALPRDGVAILNADDPRVKAMAGAVQAEVLFFGQGGEIRSEVLDIDAELRPLVRIYTPNGSFEVRLNARGEHQAMNAAAATAVAHVCRVSLKDTASALAEAKLSPLRMNLAVNQRGVHVLDDSYNANPTSVEAALRALSDLPARRRVAFLGKMAELGEFEEAEHLRVAKLAQELGIEVIAIEAPQYGALNVSLEDAAAQVKDLESGDAILVKASRSAKLEHLADMLRKL